MRIDQFPEPAWTDKESAEFREKLRRFRDGLPEDQRKAFSGLVGGASAALRPVKGTRPDEGASFAQTLARFRDGLPPRQRDAFTSIITAGALAWGVGADRAPEDDVQTIQMWHALLVPLAVIVVGAVLIADELTEDEEEILIPDIQFPD